MKRIGIIFILLLAIVGVASANYTMHVETLSNTPADGVINYFGNRPVVPTTTADTMKVQIPTSGTITRIEIYDYSGTAGSAESYGYRIRINSATDYYIDNLTVSANARVFSNTSMNIAVSAGDYFEIKRLHPTWATNPATNIVSGQIHISTTTPGYVLHSQSATASPADSSLSYLSNRPVAAASGVANHKLYVPTAGNITKVYVNDNSGTAGTAEDYGYRIRLNNGADYTISNLSVAANLRLFNNTGMDVPLAVGDYYSYKRLHPAWATNPLTNIVGANAFVSTASTVVGYPIVVQSITHSPSRNGTVYFGNLLKAPTTSVNISKIYIRETGVITKAEIFTYPSGTAGTGEPWRLYVRKVSGTNVETYLIENNSIAGAERRWDNANLNIPVISGDYLDIKAVYPNWVTPPTTIIYGGHLWFTNATTPESDFYSNVTYGSPSLAVQFTDTSRNSPTLWRWYWGADESVSSTDQNPVGVFSNGTYNVRLYTQNYAGGSWTNRSNYIIAMNNLQTVRVNASYGLTITHDVEGDWAAVRDKSTGVWYDNNAITTEMWNHNSSYIWGGAYRGGATWNLSAIPIGSSVVAAKITGYVSGSGVGTGQMRTAWIDFTPTSKMAYSYTNDIKATTFTRYTYDTPYSLVGARNSTLSWIVNPAGLAAFNTDSENNMTSFMLDNDWSIDNHEQWWAANDLDSSVGIRSPAYGSGIYTPYMDVVYVGAAGSSLAASFIPTNSSNQTAHGYAYNFTFNDTSVGTPSGWNWTFANVTGNNTEISFGTTANVTQSFGVGNYSIRLNVTDGAVYNQTPAYLHWVNVSQWNQNTTDMLPFYPANHVFNARVDDLPLHPNSASWVTAISSGAIVGYNYIYAYEGYPLNVVDSSVNKETLLWDRYPEVTDAGTYSLPFDMEYESESDDHHGVVIERDTGFYYETGYNDGRLPNDSWQAGVGRIWNRTNLSMTHPAGDSSIVAAGLPFMAGMVTEADLAGASIDHALAVSLPKTQNNYIWPATHASGTNASYPPMGARLRLKSDFDTSAWSGNQLKALNALKEYGGIVVDNNGNTNTTAFRVEEGSWSSAWNTFVDVQITDFEFVNETGIMVSATSYEATEASTPPPVASFTSNVTSGTAPLAVLFSDSSTGSPTEWNWSYKSLNKLSPNQANGTEDGTTTGFGDSGSTISSSTEQYWQGARSLKVITNNAAGGEGSFLTPTITNVETGTDYTASAYVKGNAGGETIKLFIYDLPDWSEAYETITLTTDWQRVNVTKTTSAGTTGVRLALYTSPQQGITFYVDGLQLEKGTASSRWQLPPATVPVYIGSAQNPSYTFPAGNHSITLNASNSAGYNISSQITFINASQILLAPVAAFTASKSVVRVPTIFSVTDESTNTPDGWNWSWGDGTWTNGTQNPTHKYTKRGKFSIVLLASNAGGSNTTPVATTVRAVGYENYY